MRRSTEVVCARPGVATETTATAVAIAASGRVHIVKR